MRDLRDPILLGRLIIAVRSNKRSGFLSDTLGSRYLSAPDYSHNPGPIEKYGDPTKLPSTLGTPIE